MTGNLLLNPLDFLSGVQRIQVHLGASAFIKREGLICGKQVHPLSSGALRCIHFIPREDLDLPCRRSHPLSSQDLDLP